MGRILVKITWYNEWLIDFPSRAEVGPEEADRGKAHLNDVRFNSN